MATSLLQDDITEYSLLRLNLMKDSISRESGMVLDDLLQLDQHLPTLVETMNAGLVVYNDEEEITYVNDKFCRMLGIPLEKLIDRPVTRFLNKENNSIWRDQAFKRHRSDQPPFELGFTTSKETIFSALTAPQPLYNSNNKFIGGYLICVDLNRRKWIEDVLRKSEEKYRDFVENIDEIIFGLDDKATFTYVSPVIENLLGYERSEIINRPFHSFIYHDDMLFVRDSFKELMTGIKKRIEFRLFTRDCTTRWGRASMRPIFHDGVVVGIKGILSDITDQKRVELALRVSESRYRHLVELSSDAILVHCDGVIVYCNAACVSLLQAPSQRWLLGRDFIAFVEPEDRNLALDSTLQVIGLGEQAEMIETSTLGIKGSRREVELAITPFTYNGRRAAQIIVRDIHKRKKQEQKRLVEETKHLRSEKIESLTVMAGGIAHDFNNLLTTIMGNASLARLEATVETPLHRSLVQIEKAADRAASLTRQMLDYSGKGHFMTKVMDPNEVVKELEDEIREIGGLRTTFRFNYAPTLPLIRVDRGQVSQSIFSLITNAVESFDLEGDVAISTNVVKLESDDIISLPHTAEIKPGRFVTITIEDNGTGINPEDLRYIFDPFFTRKFTGRGMGLPSALGVARGHGGAIRVTSRPRRGTRVELILPVIKEMDRWG
ncbi:PAS domain S-box protein [Calditrichota bacterium]